ncbi:MAG: mechanosensitive ion channel [Nibricoccus sp.]
MNLPIPDLSNIFKTFVAALPAVFLIIVGAVILRYLIGKALSFFAAKTRFTDQDVAPIRRVLGWIIAAASIVFILGAFGLNIGGIWGILSTILAMVAIGFVAMWSVLSNTLCTLIILVFRPFSIGDDVEFPGEPIKGRVQDLNFIYTTLGCDDGSVLQVPNNLFFQKTLRRRHSAAPVALEHRLRANREAPIPLREDVPSKT